MNTSVICKDEQRRRAVRQAALNGLDYVELQEERLLRAFFLGKAPRGLRKEHLRVRGGRRVTDIAVVSARLHRAEADDEDDYLDVRVDKRGDFSTYELCVVELDERGRETGNPYPGFDARYACAPFSFMVDCPSDLDCRSEVACPPEPRAEPEINYLAKDYASFRQLLLDRLALTMPDWTERHVPDLGLTLVELLAYVGDHLSYHQDAVAAEAYLDTARQRISVRRHARLVDYIVHDGVNARAFLHLATAVDGELPDDVSFLAVGDDPTGEPPLATDRVHLWPDVRRRRPDGGYEVFRPLPPPGEAIRLRAAHNAIRLYTWGDADCCLPRGATSATLIDGQPPQPEPDEPRDTPDTAQQKRKPPKAPPSTEPTRALDLRPGDLLLFEEVLGPRTGLPADADPTHRHVVRLTTVEPIVDALNGQPLLEVSWEQADALPFPLCVSVLGPPPVCDWLTDVSVARGNVFVVDHGRPAEDGPWCVPVADTTVTCDGPQQPSEVIHRAGRFRPRLGRGPLVFAEPYPVGRPAAALLAQEPRRAVAALRLTSAADPDCLADDPPADPPAEPCGDEPPTPARGKRAQQTFALPEPQAAPPPFEWQPRRDLLDSEPLDRHFVAEVDDRGLAHLRFGDGDLGRAPTPGESFRAAYRVGEGPAGNVGAETIRVLVADQVYDGMGWAARNPQAATGGQPPEPLADVRRFAPFAFRYRLERAITAQDYADIVMRDFAAEVQRAAATLRWSGSWYEVLVAVDARGQGAPSDDLLARVLAHLERYRRIGHDLRVAPAHIVPLHVALRVCVRPGYLAGHVKAALLARLGAGVVGGVPGFFHPDNLTFGQGVALSALVAAAQSVAGVDNVQVTRLERRYEGPAGEVARGLLPLGPLEIARLDNDPSRPDDGLLEIKMEGGR
jgi:hypothetical protein